MVIPVSITERHFILPHHRTDECGAERRNQPPSFTTPWLQAMNRSSVESKSLSSTAAISSLFDFDHAARSVEPLDEVSKGASIPFAIFHFGVQSPPAK